MLGQVMCVAGSCESVSSFVLMCWVFLSAPCLAAMVLELACSSCATPLACCRNFQTPPEADAVLAVLRSYGDPIRSWNLLEVLLNAVQLAAVVCNALGSLDIIRSWKFAGWFWYAECVNVIRSTLMLSLSHNSKHFCKS
jgi:hypothetical protein